MPGKQKTWQQAALCTSACCHVFCASVSRLPEGILPDLRQGSCAFRVLFRDVDVVDISLDFSLLTEVPGVELRAAPADRKLCLEITAVAADSGSSQRLLRCLVGGVIVAGKNAGFLLKETKE